MSDQTHWFAALIPRQWRDIHRQYARIHGYFWRPCPLCGLEFGGHEWREIDGKPAEIPDGERPNVGIGICPDCTRAGKGHRPAPDLASFLAKVRDRSDLAEDEAADLAANEKRAMRDENDQ